MKRLPTPDWEQQCIMEAKAKSSLVIEICIDSVESAVAAARGGADRLELCGNLALGGGTTPSLGLFRRIRQTVRNVPIMVMIRPRTGDFCYNPTEFEVMLEDIRIFKEEGATGVVFGVLTADGEVDIVRTKRLTAEAAPLQVCFHRAFDMTQDPVRAYNSLRCIPNITRVLTSGHAPTVPHGLPILRGLIRMTTKPTSTAAASEPTILPGSGINSASVRHILDVLLPCGLREIHLSAGFWASSIVEYRPHGMSMGVGESEWGVWQVNERQVRDVRRIVDLSWQAYEEARWKEFYRQLAAETAAEEVSDAANEKKT